MEKCGDWVQCDICYQYIYPKCYAERDISADNDFFVLFASGHKLLRSHFHSVVHSGT